MGLNFRNFAATAATAAALLAMSTAAQAAETVRVALGDVESVEQLAFMVALERAKENGLDYELTSFSKEELAIQAIISGQMDVGIGSPYAVIQKTKVPLRNIFQVSKLVFFPAVEAKYQSWKDMDGEPITLHSRGGGTEAFANIIEEREGIKFGERSYVPGSENRVVAMLKGQVNATILDLSNKNLLLREGGDKYHLLPGLEGNASDEILFANANWIAENEESVQILVDALLSTWRDMTADPTIIEKERVKYNLLSDLPAELLAEVDAYYKEAVEGGLYDPNGGGESAALSDFDFFVKAGQLEGPADSLKVEDFWELGPLNKAIEKLGS